MTECKKCVLNTNDDKSIQILEDGICNYCHHFEKQWLARGDLAKRTKELSKLINEMKSQKGKYNCLLGLSGGVDSSYLAYWAKQEGLKPLIVHFDNGWNSELAVENIHNICTQLGYDLQTIVIDWHEFKNLQLAYLKASVVDIEALTDHAIYATITQLANKNNIKYIVSGYNLATEGIMPKGWVYDKRDWNNIKDIALKYGAITSFKTFPHVSFWKGLKNHFFNEIVIVQPLNSLEYNKDAAKELLINQLGWKDYGGKHYESIFTKFYQAYILPHKFKIDKRKAHLSTLINSGQLSKDDAIQALATPLYNANDFENDKAYLLKKFELTASEFENILGNPVQAHQNFKSDKQLWKRYFKLINILKFKFKS